MYEKKIEIVNKFMMKNALEFVLVFGEIYAVNLQDM